MTELTVQQAYDLGVAHYRARRPLDAESIFRQVLATDPTHLPSWLALAEVLYGTARPVEAVAAMRQAVALNPHSVDIQSNLGTVLAATGQLDEAIAAFTAAISLSPNVAGLHSNLGNVLQSKGQFEHAVEAYRRAVALQPDSAESHNNLGTALVALDRRDEAIPEFRAALALQPDFAHALSNLGTALGENGLLDESIATCLRAIAVDPDFRGVWRNLGNSYRDAGELDKAIDAYRKAAEKKNDPSAVDDLFLALLLHPDLTREQVWQEHVAWNREYARPLMTANVSHPNDPDPNRRLRIGYVSPDFSEHPVGRFFLPVIANHDHANFEIYCYDDTRRPDPLTVQARGHADVWRRTIGVPDTRLVELVRNDQIDILIDLAMHTKRNRLLAFARKPAPVQTTYLAYPGTTGLETMDYRITDSYLDPPEASRADPEADESFQSERSIRLPHSYWCYQPHRLSPEVSPLPASKSPYVTFGCLNIFSKMNAPLFERWAQILNNVADSRFIVYCFEGSQRTRFLDFMSGRGVNTNRFELVPRATPARYFARYHSIDLALDTNPFPGGTTTCDALYMGVPVVTLAGSTPLSRGGVSILSNVGLPELIATTGDQYIQIASALARDRPRLAEYRATLRRRMAASPLMSAPQHTREVEAAYRQMWRNWCQQTAGLK